MGSSSIFSMIIPGYDTLSKVEREVFEQSQPGRSFIELGQRIEKNQADLENSNYFWQSFTGTAQKRNQELQAQFDQQIKDFIDSINSTTEYKILRRSLMQKVFIREIDDFKLLATEQLQELANTEWSLKLFETCTSLDTLMEKQRRVLSSRRHWQVKDETELNKLQDQRAQALRLLLKEFQELPELEPLKKTIAETKALKRKEEMPVKRAQLQEHATQLSTFFPLLNYRKFTSEEPIINQLRAKYFMADGEVISDPGKVDEEQLTDLLYHCIQQVSALEIDFIDLQAFNKESARKMAIAVLQAFSKQARVDLDTWVQTYENELHSYIIKQLQLINGKRWQLSAAGEKADLVDSLSYLWTNQVVSKTNNFIKKMADAHGFIQATNFSSRSDSSFLAILDIYNYARHQEQISETRSIIANLLSPLLPLYDEYKDIALYEKNAYWKAFRTIMPIIVIAATIILVAALLAPLVLPELAFAAAFIPALLLGLGFAKLYVTSKNELYKNVRERFYGGPFEIPEFQVNTRMLSAFGDETNAKKVREFYVDELKKCEALELTYSQKHDEGLLSKEDIDLRKENITKKHQLSLEWYDIHSNKDLNYKQTPLIVIDRLKQQIDQEYVQLKTTLQGELDSIRKSATEVADDIKTTIAKHNKPPVIEAGKEIEGTTIKENYRFGLFKRPKALSVKAHIEELDHFIDQISCVKT
jgi:hypothetical protein